MLIMSEQKSFFSCDNVSHKGQTNTWFTPKHISEPLGAFDLDPCTQSFRPFDIGRVNYCEDEGQDGLALTWFGRVWLNPPYGRFIGTWLDRLRRHGNGMALVFGRTETKWGQKALRTADAVLFLSGRISFIKHDGSKSNNAGTGNMLLAYGDENVTALKRLEGVIYTQPTPTQGGGGKLK